MNTKPESEGQDVAWVTIETPFDGGHLKDFLGDIERLYRINSLTEFEEWRNNGNGKYLFRAKNLSNGKNVETGLDVAVSESGVNVSYSSGLKTATRFRIEPNADGLASLVITDDYGGTPAEVRKSRIDEVDKSLEQWGRDIHRYLHQWKRWSWLPGWRWYMRRVWQPMKPSARRISFMIIMITLAELVMFLFVFLIFWLELDKFMD
jgi:hypothetical protein